MTFHERMAQAAEWEATLLAALNEQGWPAFPFGQAQLPDECRARLSRFEDSSRRPSRIRWMPDIITYRDSKLHKRSWVALIDAKKASPNSDNHAIEMSAMETCEIYADSLYTPTFFVFSDWTVLTPFEVRQRGTPGKHNGNGSGTPFLLVPKKYGRPFPEIFPATA